MQRAVTFWLLLACLFLFLPIQTSLAVETANPSDLPTPIIVPPIPLVDTPTIADVPPRSASGDPYIGPRGISEIVIHHSGSPQSPSYSALQTVEGYRRYHREVVHPGVFSNESTWASPNMPAQEGFPDGFSNDTGFNSNEIDYHYLISSAGEVIAGRPLSTVGWNASNWASNLRNIGICFIGNFNDSQPTDAALTAGIKLIADLCVRYQIYTISKHSEYSSTDCPGWAFPFDKLKTESLNRAGIFSDTSYTDWFHAFIVDHGMMVGNIITGYPDGSFKPNNPITRAEFTSMIWRTEGRPVVVNKVNFADIVGHWSEPAVQWAYQTHLVSGYSANIFKPDDYLSRAEAAQIMRLWRVLSDGVMGAKYSDVDGSAWYAASVNCVTVHGLMNGYPDGTFRPEVNITRAEAVSIITRIVKP